MVTTKDPAGATLAELAHLLACDVSLIDGLVKKNIAVRITRGRYDATETVRNYVKHLREQAAGRVGVTGLDAVAAGIALKEAQTRRINQQHDIDAGLHLPVESIRSTWGGIMRSVRQFVLGLANAIAFELPHLTVHDRKVILRLCRDGLADAAMARGYTIVAKEEGGEDSGEEGEA